MSLETTYALVRRPGPNAGDGLTTAGLGPPAEGLLRGQHRAYVEALRQLGVEVIELEPLAGCPDAWFVEDAAVVVPRAGVVVMTRPGAPGRRPEGPSIEAVLRQWHDIERIGPPGTLDGGDVLLIGARALIGVSARTDRVGAEQLGATLRRHGYDVSLIEVPSGLHLKSSMSRVDDSAVVVTASFAGHPALAGLEQIVLADEEAAGANLFQINGHVVLSAGHPRLTDAIRERGLPTVEIDVSEVAKMDGALTCMSLRFTKECAGEGSLPHRVRHRTSSGEVAE